MRTLELYNGASFLNKELPEQTVFLMTKREKEILILICKGYTNKAIASVIGTSEQTIKNQITNLMRITKSQNRTELAIRTTTNDIDIGMICETV